MFGRRKEREAEREALLEALRLVIGTVERQIEVVREQNEAMRMYFSFLEANGAPESRTVRDEDEFEMELERAKRVRVWHGEES